MNTRITVLFFLQFVLLSSLLFVIFSFSRVVLAQNSDNTPQGQSSASQSHSQGISSEVRSNNSFGSATGTLNSSNAFDHSATGSNDRQDTNPGADNRNSNASADRPRNEAQSNSGIGKGLFENNEGFLDRVARRIQEFGRTMFQDENSDLNNRNERGVENRNEMSSSTSHNGIGIGLMGRDGFFDRVGQRIQRFGRTIFRNKESDTENPRFTELPNERNQDRSERNNRIENPRTGPESEFPPRRSDPAPQQSTTTPRHSDEIPQSSTSTPRHSDPVPSPNSISFEARVTNQNGEVITDWTSSPVSIRESHVLHFRWDAPGYTRCLPYINDNGQYSLRHSSSLDMTTGNTEETDFEVPLRNTAYRIQCVTAETPGSSHDAVHEKRIEVTVE